MRDFLSDWLFALPPWRIQLGCIVVTLVAIVAFLVWAKYG